MEGITKGAGNSIASQSALTMKAYFPEIPYINCHLVPVEFVLNVLESCFIASVTAEPEMSYYTYL